MLRKKGIYTITSVFFMMAYVLLGAILINVQSSVETHRRVIQATSEAAQERSRAIDIRLKESEGVIEMYRTSVGYPDNVTTHSKSGAPYDGRFGHKTPLRPYATPYQEKYVLADTVAKQGVVDFLDKIVHKNANKQDILPNFNKENVCISVVPLPETKKPTTLECTTKLGKVSFPNAQIKSIPEATQVIYDPDGKANNGDEYVATATNVAFVGVKYEQRYFMANVVGKLGLPTSRTYHTWAVAYPQIERCYEGASFCS
ncbi:hypothetical protein [Bacillus bombysepticus]|uniref:hypothetical protein n=1 Tax=Bacillus bombysepticus TaxID=658666 RepID=UPI003017D2FE